MVDIQKIFFERLAKQEEFLGVDKPINHIQPLVSVVTTTYQQKDYIEECLESLLKQETDFPYEIIVGEDGSIDGTREICIDYAKKNQDKIRLFLRDRNISVYHEDKRHITRFNGPFSRSSCRGKYLALCEGDDYWSDIRKLQKQVDYMEDHKECGLVFGHALVFSEQEKDYIGLTGKEINGFNDLIKKNTIPTVTVLYQKGILNEYDREIKPLSKHWTQGDYPIWLYIAMKSKIHMLHETLAVYRKRKNSISHSVSIRKRILFINNSFSIRKYYYSLYFRKKMPMRMYLNFYKEIFSIVIGRNS